MVREVCGIRLDLDWDNLDFPRLAYNSEKPQTPRQMRCRLRITINQG